LNLTSIAPWSRHPLTCLARIDTGAKPCTKPQSKLGTLATIPSHHLRKGYVHHFILSVVTTNSTLSAFRLDHHQIAVANIDDFQHALHRSDSALIAQDIVTFVSPSAIPLGRSNTEYERST
jgi:hypothetical protein